MIMQNVYVNFKKAFTDYFELHPALNTLKVKDGTITLADVPWPPSKPGWGFSISRYAKRKISFYARFILPDSMNKKIIWAKKSDPDFVAYLKAKQDLFLISGDKQ